MTLDLTQATTLKEQITRMVNNDLRFQPDYRHLADAAWNRRPRRYPLYEHGVHWYVMEDILGVKFLHLFESKNRDDLRSLFRHYNEFWRRMGYDVVVWEVGIASAMPGNGALGAHRPGAIHCRRDFEEYPWHTIEDRYFAMWGPYFDACYQQLPEGMLALGGTGNGIFECVQDVVGYENLCLIRGDDPDLYADLFRKVGETNTRIWRRFLDTYGDYCAVCRFGDDLGFKSATLISPDDIRTHIVPQYKKIIDQVHAAGKPFLLHSCGNIFPVMEDMIETAGINAKHSNEDAIAPFATWIDRYSQHIGLFGGMDVDILSQGAPTQVERAMRELLGIIGRGQGIALGSGNSIPDYVPTLNYLTMIATIRQWRGDFN
jgi:uroporphyrinogen decarboxylase